MTKSKSRDLGDLAQTVAVNLPTALGTAGQTLVVNSGADGLEFGAAGSSVTAVQDLTALGNISSPSVGDMALVTDLNKIFVRKAAGWFLIATVTNQGPQSVSIAISGGGSGTSSAYDLATDGSTTSSVTGSADPDPEADDLTWSAAAGTSTAFSATLTDGGGSVNITTSADTNTVLSTISQSSNVFTLTPSSSTTAPSGGTFAVTFSVTDGVNTSVDNLTTFTLSFTSWSNATQQAKIQASDAEASDLFGQSVSISSDGNTAIVGAKNEDTTATNAGSAYIFTRSGSTWSQQQKIQASDAYSGDQFGLSVSISGDGNTVIVGSIYQDTSATNAGSAYIFTRSGSTWSQQAKIQASDAQDSDYFGQSVSISSDGDTAIVGARFEDTNGSNAGSAYIFTRSGSTWSQQQKIQASDAEASDDFGWSVSISGDGNTAIVGARLEDTTATDAGSAYIFTRSGSTWSQQAKIQASDAEASDDFGYSVSISSDGNTAIVGADTEDTTASNAGSAYIFTRSGSTWSQQAKIQASDAQANDQFGWSVSISGDGDTAIVSAYLEDTSGTSAGSAYIFTRSGTTWSQQAKVQASDAQSADEFGYSVSISSDGDTAIVGARFESTTAASAGSAYIFVKG